MAQIHGWRFLVCEELLSAIEESEDVLARILLAQFFKSIGGKSSLNTSFF